MRRLFLSLACASLFFGATASVQAQGQPRLFYGQDCQPQPPCGQYHFLPTPAPGQPAAPGQTTPGQPTPAPGTEPYLPTAPFAQAPMQGTAAAESFNPNMIGDFPTYYFTPHSFRSGPYSSSYSSSRKIPIAGRSNFKVAENESPRATTRVYFGFNHFSDVSRKFDAPDARSTDYRSSLLGFEYAFCGNRASVGVRIPYTVLDSKDDGAINSSNIGDITLTSKYVLWDDERTGDVLSIGCLVTIPTQETAFDEFGQPFRSTLIQPWTGFICNVTNSCFLQGFSSVTIPTASEDASIWFNDIGVGFRCYENPDACWLAAIVPTLELHAATPLSKRGLDVEPIGVTDMVNLTGGLHFICTNRASLTVGAATPVLGQRLFNWEGIVQLNWRF